MTQTPLWWIRIIGFLLPLEDIEDLKQVSYSASWDYSTRFQYSLKFQFFTIITHSTWIFIKKLKKNQRDQIKHKDFPSTHEKWQACKKLLWLSPQSCVHTRLVESNTVKFAIEQTGTDRASRSCKVTRLPAALSPPSPPSHLQVCAGSCDQTCHKPRNLLTLHKTKLPIRHL